MRQVIDADRVLEVLAEELARFHRRGNDVRRGGGRCRDANDSGRIAITTSRPTVNTASRMESQGVAGRVQVSEATYVLVKDDFLCEERGAIEVRGRGPLWTYFVLTGR